MTTHGEALDEHLGTVVARARAVAHGRAAETNRLDLADDAALVVSELVANAVLHGGGCTSVAVTAIAGGLRIEVDDSSRLPPVIGHASEASLTGRGLRLVSRLSAGWGADVNASGKVVWAEVTGVGSLVDADTTADELLAMWDDDFDESVIERFHLELGDVPTDLLLDAKAHVDNVVRELTLAAAGATAGITSKVPPHLTKLLGAVDAFADARVAVKHQALEAARTGDPTTSLSLDLPASAAGRAEAYLEALDELDAYSRAVRLLTLETPPQHRVFRHWYIGELVSQLRAAAAGDPPPPTQSFLDRILVELDRVAAAQRAAERAARLNSVTVALASAATPEDVASAVLDVGVPTLGAAGGGVLLTTNAATFALPGTVGYEPDVIERLRNESVDAELPAAYALRTGRSVWIESREERDRLFPDLTLLEATTVALCAVPLEVQGRRLGSMRFSFNEARLFDDEERAFVTALAAQTAQALDRAQLQRQRVDVSRRLQRSLLPPKLPEIPGIDAAAIYHPFGDGIDVGGDFYDLWPIGPRRWAVAIGDASGTGPEAAALTALVRHTLRALTMSDFDLEQVLQSLNTALFDSLVDDDDRFCTAILGVITIDDGVVVDLASGGHPPALVRRGSGTVESIVIGGGLLGIFEQTETSTVRVRLSPGDMLLVVTDGVLEARYNGEQFETEGVERVLAAPARSAEESATNLETAVLAHTDGVLGDDMAAIFIRVT